MADTREERARKLASAADRLENLGYSAQTLRCLAKMLGFSHEDYVAATSGIILELKNLAALLSEL